MTSTAPVTFYANGKLLLTGEYVVLQGAKALALPLSKGQSMRISQPKEIPSDRLKWTSYTNTGEVWLDTVIALPELEEINSSSGEEGPRLAAILKAVQKLEPKFSDYAGGCHISTRLDFPRKYGFGSSSTLIHLLHLWTEIDPYKLLADTFGGSGYDLACAASDQPLFYSLTPEPVIETVDFNPNFKDKLHFAYLGKKQNSREGIKRFSEQKQPSKKMIARISEISEEIAKVDSLIEFCSLLNEHEQLISSIIGLPKAQHLFSGFDGVVKSLGAWGGDFVLLAGENAEAYLKEKQWPVYFEYGEIVYD